MKSFPTVILYDRAGFELTREDEVDGMKLAKERARYLLSDRYAISAETTHEQMDTMKVAIFAEGEETGADRPCEWDQEHPQHRKWQLAQPVE